MQKIFSRADWQLGLPLIILMFISLMTLFSVNLNYFRNQIIFSALAIVIFVLCSQINYSIFKTYSLYMYILSLIILSIVLLLGIETRGAVRWLGILGFRLQFSELLKPFLALALAGFLSQRKISLATFCLVIIFLFPITILLYRQPDLGNAILYAGTVLLTLFYCGYSLVIFAISFAGIGIFIPIFFRFLHQYQRERLLTFFHLTNDPLGISYNAIQSMIAVGSGTFLGKGLGQGTQSMLRFLPERHTDFIFATLSEELGFVGASIVIAAFAFLFYRLYTIIVDTTDLYAKIFMSCCFWLLFMQFFVNIGMNLGIVPIVGITLPFVSYGGSSLISSAIFLGIFSGMRQKITTNIMEIT